MILVSFVAGTSAKVGEDSLGNLVLDSCPGRRCLSKKCRRTTSFSLFFLPGRWALLVEKGCR